MKEITLWYRWVVDTNKTGRWDFNHIDDEYDLMITHPQSKVPDHDKVWKGGQWKSEQKYLDENNRIV